MSRSFIDCKFFFYTDKRVVQCLCHSRASCYLMVCHGEIFPKTIVAHEHWTMWANHAVLVVIYYTFGKTWSLCTKFYNSLQPSQCSMVVLTLSTDLNLGVRTPKPLNKLTKNLAWVIMSAMTPCMPKLIMNAQLGTWWCKCEISPSRGL